MFVYISIKKNKRRPPGEKKLFDYIKPGRGFQICLNRESNPLLYTMMFINNWFAINAIKH